MENWYNILPLILVIAGGAALLALDDWRFMLGGLAATYLGAFLLIVQDAPTGIAVIKLVTGLMATVLLFVSLKDSPRSESAQVWASLVFKVTALALVWLVVMLVAGSFQELFPLNYETLAACLIAISGGLLILGTSKEPLKVTLGILVIYAGFDIIYTPLESSILINGLLSLITMLIALVGVYISGRHESEYEE